MYVQQSNFEHIVHQIRYKDLEIRYKSIWRDVEYDKTAVEKDFVYKKNVQRNTRDTKDSKGIPPRIANICLFSLIRPLSSYPSETWTLTTAYVRFLFAYKRRVFRLLGQYISMENRGSCIIIRIQLKRSIKMYKVWAMR